MHCIDYDSRGPKSGWFGLVSIITSTNPTFKSYQCRTTNNITRQVDPRIADTPDSKVHFDANMFWTVKKSFDMTI